MQKYKTFTVTPTVEAGTDYADGDVLFSPTEISGFFPNKNSSAQIVRLFIIDKVCSNSTFSTVTYNYYLPVYGFCFPVG